MHTHFTGTPSERHVFMLGEMTRPDVQNKLRALWQDPDAYKPKRTNRDITELDNRFSTMNEVRRVGWPSFEDPQHADPMFFQQGIAGTLELFFRAWERFQAVVGEVTGHPVPMFQRIDHAGRGRDVETMRPHERLYERARRMRPPRNVVHQRRELARMLVE